MHSVAEQVEDAEMAALLREIGVDYLQGYHIHRPEAFPNWQPFTSTQTGTAPTPAPAPTSPWSNNRRQMTIRMSVTPSTGSG